MSMAMDMPPADAAPTASVGASSDLPAIQTRGGAPASVRYSDFLKLVKGDRVEKVTFSADGTQLLGVDTDGSRLKIEALPNDPDLLTELTSHKVCPLFYLFDWRCVAGVVVVKLTYLYYS